MAAQRPESTVTNTTGSKHRLRTHHDMVILVEVTITLYEISTYRV